MRFRCHGRSATSRATSATEVGHLCLAATELDPRRARSPVNRRCQHAVLMAEIVHHYFPKLVELHNYR